MKKILIITVALLSLLSVGSCGKKDETATSGSTFSLKGSGS